MISEPKFTTDGDVLVVRKVPERTLSCHKGGGGTCLLTVTPLCCRRSVREDATRAAMPSPANVRTGTPLQRASWGGGKGSGEDGQETRDLGSRVCVETDGVEVEVAEALGEELPGQVEN
eukprot:758404-Hanusia_phi.AAC.1